MPSAAKPIEPFDPRAEQRAARAGARFTVIAIVTVLVLVVAAVAFSRLQRGGDKPRGVATRASMRTIVTAIKGYKANKGVYPPSIEALEAEQLVERVTGDAWKRPFIYATPGPAGRDFALISLGPDGTQGTDDDIDWQRVEQE